MGFPAAAKPASYAMTVQLKRRPSSRGAETVPVAVQKRVLGGIMPRALLALVVVLVAAANPLMAQGKGIRMWNLTTARMTGFELSPAGKNDWGPNQTLNDRDKTVDHDERLRITGVEPERYDAKVSYADARQCF